MSNYINQNLINIPASGVPSGTLAFKVGDHIFTAGSLSGVELSESELQAYVVVDVSGTIMAQKLAFTGTQPSDQGQPSQIENLGTFNTGHPEPSGINIQSEQIPLIITPTGAISACTIFSNKQPCLYFNGSFIWWVSQYRSDWSTPDIGQSTIHGAGNNNDSDFYIAWTIGKQVCIKGYQLKAFQDIGSNHGMISWYLQGSNDCNTWNTIHQGNRIEDSSIIQYCSVSFNTTSYLFYRIKVNQMNTFPVIHSLMAFSQDINNAYL